MIWSLRLGTGLLSNWY